jgi:hypothetical protein
MFRFASRGVVRFVGWLVSSSSSSSSSPVLMLVSECAG